MVSRYAERYERLKAEGKCPRCRKPRDTDGVYCVACNDKQADACTKSRYGTTEGELLAKQGGVCAICGEAHYPKSQTRMHVDHDHVTGKVRGVLCKRCNNLLGFAHDDPQILRNALAYLERTT